MATNRVLQVVVADDSVVYRAALARLLISLPHIELVGQAADGAEALQLVQRLVPDLLILDLGMPKLSGIEVLAHVRALQLPVVVLVHSAQANACDEPMLQKLGAAAFVPKGEVEALVLALVRIAESLE